MPESDPLVQWLLVFFKDFTSVLWEGFPFVVIGAFVAGLLEELVPQQAITKIIPRNRYVAIAIGSCLGAVFPMCECGIVPVMRRLLRKGLPLSVCTAYMLAGPIVNAIVIWATWEAFTRQEIALQMVGFRVGMGLLVACVTAIVVDGLEKRVGIAQLLTPLAAPPSIAAAVGGDPLAEDVGVREKKPLLIRLSNISETSMHDFVDIMLYLTVGALLSAFAHALLEPQDFKRLANSFPALAILAMMLLAILLCLCSEADAFVAASFTTMPAATKIAFMVLGPMFDLKLLLMYTRVFRRKMIITLVAMIISQIFVYSLLIHYLIPESFFVAPLKLPPE